MHYSFIFSPVLTQTSENVNTDQHSEDTHLPEPWVRGARHVYLPAKCFYVATGRDSIKGGNGGTMKCEKRQSGSVDGKRNPNTKWRYSHQNKISKEGERSVWGVG